MNKRQRNKNADPIKEAFNVLCEAMATTGIITFFIDPDFDNDMNCFKLHDSQDRFSVVSKPVRNEFGGINK